jgi:hypothetical protein
MLAVRRSGCRSRDERDQAVREMEVLARLFLFAAACVGFLAAPTAFLLLWHTYPDTWLTKLKTVQTLGGAFVALFAASLGTFGVLLTIRNQRLNVQNQLSAQRRDQDRSRLIARQHVASAFIGEISVFIEETEGELVRPILAKVLHDLETSIGKIEVTTVRLSGPRTYYESNPGNVGLFHNGLPEELTRFYNRVALIQSDLEKYSSGAEEVISQGKLPATMSMDWVMYSLRRCLTNIDLCQERGRFLIKELQQFGMRCSISRYTVA